ncbi:MAG: DUF302 domain-containing protein [Gammaproteobacteria bacterium]|nr:DUF302 domain-containing protein [Gammaproteobacteria bacterium]
MYEINTTLNGSFDSVKEKVLSILTEEQLGVVSELNVQATMKKKLDIDIPAYQILGACNPKLALQIIEADPNAGNLLPCNFIIREAEPNKIVVGFMDPITVLALAESDVINDVAKIARDKIDRVIAKLSQ